MLPLDFGKLFQIDACKSKHGLPFHPRLSIFLCIAEASFNTTIQNFIRVVLSKLEKMNASQYVAALYDFFNCEYADKLIANPVRGSGYCFGVDTVQLRHIPRETAPGSGEFKIYEYYEVKLLQALLKMDFYKALEAGCTIRKCAYCERFFLLKDARHTKYCALPSPGNPKYTCPQLGYHFKRVKEMADDNPRSQSLRRCFQRIDRDVSRNVIKAYIYEDCTRKVGYALGRSRIASYLRSFIRANTDRGPGK